MLYYCIKLLSIPKILFAHSYEVKSFYEYNAENKRQHIEISYIEKGNIIRQYSDGSRLDIPEGSFITILPDESFIQYSYAPVHRHLTFAFVCNKEYANPGYAYSDSFLPYQGSEAEVLLPKLLLTDSSAELKECMRQIVNCNNITGDRLNNLKIMELVFKFMYIISEITSRTYHKDSLSGLTPGSMLYVKKAKQYIAQHINEKIFVNDISSFLGISSGHLSTIFKEATNHTIIDYINRMKLNKARDLIMIQKLPVRQVGEMIGIEDEHYLCRLFKKYYGMSIRNYRSMFSNV